MKFELDLWQAILLVSMIIGAFWGIARMMMAQGARNLDEKFSEIRKRLDDQDGHDQRLSSQLNDMRVELPRDYVRREDFTRTIATFQVSVDNLRLTIERYILGRPKE